MAAGIAPGRLLDDDVQILLRYKGGARGMLWASQVAVGNENNLKLRIYGTKGGLEWAQENPNNLWFTRFGQPKQLLTRAGAGAPGTSGGAPAQVVAEHRHATQYPVERMPTSGPSQGSSRSVHLRHVVTSRLCGGSNPTA